MSTFYVDYEGGSDGANGLSFANRKKTISSANSVAAAGDTIRVMASTDATSIGSATWNSNSKTVTLASALTANVSLCQASWTAAASVTTSTSATRKQGTVSAQMAIAAGFATGQVARESFSVTDFSAYQQVSFWIRTSAAIAVSTLEIRLCSDAAGTTTVNTIPIPAIPNLNLWTAITYNTGGALGASIQSVVLHALLDPGTVTVLLDNILACKASSSADSLCLNSVIGKNTDGETWHAIQSINGTDVLIDANANSLPTVGRGYTGTTETVTSYKRNVIATDLSAATPVFSITVSGAVGSPIAVSGGWNRTDMTTQTGETHYSGRNGSITAISGSVMSNLTFDKISLYRYATGINFSGGNSLSFSNAHLNHQTNAGFSTTSKNGILNSVYVSNNGTNGAEISAPHWTITGLRADNNLSGIGFRIEGTSNLRGDTILVRNNASYGMQNVNAYDSQIYNFTTASNGTNGLRIDSGQVFLHNATLSEASPVDPGGVTFTGSFVRANKWAGSSTDHRTYVDIGNIVSVSDSDRHTLSGLAWKFSPTSANASIGYPLLLNVAKIACAANTLVTVKIWVKRSNTGITARMVMRGGQIAGQAAELVATASAGAGTYEEISFTFTPTEAGVVDIDLEAYGGTTFNAWFDDMTITQL